MPHLELLSAFVVVAYSPAAAAAVRTVAKRYITRHFDATLPPGKRQYLRTLLARELPGLRKAAAPTAGGGLRLKNIVRAIAYVVLGLHQTDPSPEQVAQAKVAASSGHSVAGMAIGEVLVLVAVIKTLFP